MEEIDQSVDVSTDDSPVMKALRSQIRDLEKALKDRPAPEEVESKLRNQLKREADAAALLTKQGQPSGLAEFMLSKIGDQEVSEQSVAGFLQGLGFDAKPASDDGQETAPATQQLAEVADLAGRVSAAASNAPVGNLEDRIAKATTRAEIDAIMAEAGLMQSTY